MPELRRRFNELALHLCRAEDYDRVKAILNAGRHPAFVGRDTVRRCANNGGVFIWSDGDADVATAIINPSRSVLLVLNVVPAYRGVGVGGAVVEFLRPNFVRALESRVKFFESLGYVSVGSLKIGRSLNTQIMVRRGLMELSGRLARVLDGRCRCHESEGKATECTTHAGVAA